VNPQRFAATKIQPPRLRATRLARPALESGLGAALASARVVLLQAPAGFGKTSALAAALAALPTGTALAWVSLDEDDDAECLVACLAAALEPVDLPWRTAPEALAALPLDARGSPSRAIGELVNALAQAGVAHGVIVLDDLHRVGDSGLLRGLELLIERAPSDWTLVLASRTAPPLALARWRALGELVDFDQDALRFTSQETHALAQSAGLGADQAASLHERTAGWPAGVRLGLAAHAAQPGRPARLDRPLFEFLASEVLDPLPAELHEFLLRVAVLPSFNAAEAAAVSGDARSALWMDEVERRGLFVTTLDGPERTLVLHDLLRDALAERLQRRHPDQWPHVLQRAALTSTDPLRRLHLLLRIPDPSAAEAALAEAAGLLLVRGGAPQLERAIGAFDATARQGSPTLRRLGAMAAYLRWDWEGCAREAQAAARLAAERGDAAERQLAQAYLAQALYPLDRNDEAQALIAALKAEVAPTAHARLITLMADASQHLRRGELPELPALYAQILALLEAGAPLLNWWEAAPPVNWTTLPGMRRLVERYLAGARAHAGDEPLPLVADLRLLEAFNHLWAGRVEASLAAAEQVAQDLRWLAVAGEVAVNLDVLRVLQSALRQRAGETRERMAALLARVSDDGPATPERQRLWRHHMAIYGVRTADLIGDGPDAIAHWASMLRENPLNDSAPSNARAIFTRARHAAAQGRWNDAASLFVQLLPRTPRMDVMGQAIEAQLRAAHALVQCRRFDEAAAALIPALQRIARDGELGQALLIGPARLRELSDARWDTRLAAAEAQTLTAALRLAEGASHAQPTAAPRAAPEGLSEREDEVLRLLAEGQSNKLIARELDISPHTVKRHVANILDKLNLSSRGQAAAWLRRQQAS
jgi:LuxR family transcriptional regulator, maltose regulon positive regulatory protein